MHFTFFQVGFRVLVGMSIFVHFVRIAPKSPTLRSKNHQATYASDDTSVSIPALCLGRYFGIDSSIIVESVATSARCKLCWFTLRYFGIDSSIIVESVATLGTLQALLVHSSIYRASTQYCGNSFSLQTSLQSCRDTHLLPWCEVISGHHEVVTFAPAQGDRPTYMRIHI